MLGRLPRMDAATADGVVARRVAAANVRHAPVAELLRTFFRVSTYANDPDRMSAGAAIAQLQLALRRGTCSTWTAAGRRWSTAPGARPREAGVRIVTRRRRGRARARRRGVRGVRLRDGERWTAPCVVSHAAAAAVAALPALDGTRCRARCARRACPSAPRRLDLGLARLPRPERLRAFGLDRAVVLLGALRGRRASRPRAARSSTPRATSATTGGASPRPSSASWTRSSTGVQPGWRDARGRAPVRAGADGRARAAARERGRPRGPARGRGARAAGPLRRRRLGRPRGPAGRREPRQRARRRGRGDPARRRRRAAA